MTVSTAISGDGEGDDAVQQRAHGRGPLPVPLVVEPGRLGQHPAGAPRHPLAAGVVLGDRDVDDRAIERLSTQRRTTAARMVDTTMRGSPRNHSQTLVGVTWVSCCRSCSIMVLIVIGPNVTTSGARS